MQGMSYKYIHVDSENELDSHKTLLALADHSAYSADVYSRLEEFLLRHGYRADANEAFIAGKVRERKECFRSGDWFEWLISWVLLPPRWLWPPPVAGWHCLCSFDRTRLHAFLSKENGTAKPERDASGLQSLLVQP
jgi:hypothetical protein